MFDDIIRELKRLEQPRRVSINVALDDKGYYDRECPNSECGGHFKVLFDDWRDKVRDEQVFCPFCRHEDESGAWNTPEQQRYIEQVAHAEMSRLLNGALSRAVSRTRPRHFGGGLLRLSMSLSYKPGSIPAVFPVSAREELRQDFTCEACGCRYASLGASFFCPACGHNSAASCFDNTLETVRKTVAAFAGIRSAIEQEANADAAADAAADAIRQVLEDQFPRLVGAFERLNEALFAKLPNESQFIRKGNVFQRLDDAATLWMQATGKGYGDFLDAGELQRLKLLFQRRHVLSHRQGIVDQAYLDKSGDRTYAVGQRLVFRDADVLELIDLLARVAAGLRSLI
ncbi:MAG: hypothetical protein KF841_02895 [Phycisphaerae bacterium]|nr:hypothetical protein [Phycisphaerae bacterium]